MSQLLTQTYYRLQFMLLALFYPVKLFDRINQLTWYQKTLHQWVNDQHFSTGSKVLEAGCATGAITHYINQQGANSTGIDADKNMIRMAQHKYPEIPFIEADIFDLPFAENSFDAVIATSLINIIDDKVAAIKQLVKVCKPEGQISILVPDNRFDNDQLSKLRASLGLSAFSAAALEAWHKSAPKMSKNELTSLFKQAGLVNIKPAVYLSGYALSVSANKQS